MALSPKLFVFLALFGGAGFILIGVLSLTLAPNIINRKVVEMDYLGYDPVDNGTAEPNAMTAKWLHPPYEMRMHFWLFTIMNEMDILKGAKPRVEEIGPFTFIEHQEKTFHQFDRNGTRVFYRNNRLYAFNRTLSCRECSLDTNVTIPNIVFQKLVDFALLGPLYKMAIEVILAGKRESPYIKVTVGEVLFDGYHDPLLNLVCNHSIISSLCKLAKIPEKIGFFYGQNNTDDGLYEVNTGLGAPWNIGKVVTWNNLTMLPETTWHSKYARMINGTDGQLFSPLLKTTSKLEIFAAPICRSISLEFRSEVEFRGVSAYRFGVPPRAYDPSLPANMEFCLKTNVPTFFSNSSIQIPGCLPAGLLDIGHCQPGEPRVYLSQAHFLNSPYEVWSSVRGLTKPTFENDDTFVDLEPTTGVPVNAKRVMQLNVGMIKGNLNALINTTNIIMPVLWMNETAWFDEGTRDQLVNELLFSKRFAFILGIILLSVGILVWFGLIAVIVIHSVKTNQVEMSQSDDQQPIMDNEYEDTEREEIGN